MEHHGDRHPENIPLLSQLKLHYAKPINLVALLLIAFLVYIVVVPVGYMLSSSLRWQPGDVRLSRAAEPGKFTLFHWERVLASPLSSAMFYEPLINTMVVSICTSFLALVIGLALAWLLERTDLPGRKWFAWFAPLPYMMPSWYIALAWIVFFKNDRIGGSTGLFQHVFGIAPPDWISYGPIPIIITLAIHYYPFAFMLVSSALASIDSSVEEVALTLGASRGRILRRITFPLVLPAILSSFILTFSRAMGTFGTPSFLGSPVRYYTLSTMLYANLQNRLAADAYVIAFFLIVASSAIVFINQKLIGSRKSYATITGKGHTTQTVSLGRARWPIAIAMGLFFGVVVVVPLVLLVWQTLMKVDGDFSLSNLTLHYWIGEAQPLMEAGLLRSPVVGPALWNTLKVAVLSATLCAFLGLMVGYLVIRMRGSRLARLLEQIAFMPYLIPSIAFGAIYLTMFSKPIGVIPSLYGTLTILVLVSVAKYLPLAARTGMASMIQMGQDLEEAAIVQGAGWRRRFTNIILPLTKSGAVSGFLFAFISGMKELSLVVMLVTPKTATLNTLTYRYAERGVHQLSDAIILVIIVFILAAHGLTNWVARREGSRGVGV